MLLRCAISSMVIGRLVIAQSYDCNAPYSQINSSTEATTLAQQCPSAFQMSIGPGGSISGDISFNGLQTCGSLFFGGGNGGPEHVTSVASNSLYLVQWTLTFQHLPALQTLSFPNLTEFANWNNDSYLSLYYLPLLTELKLGAGLGLVSFIDIVETGLKSFNASLPHPFPSNTSGYDFTITQNPNMSQIHLGLETWNGMEDCRSCGVEVSNNALGAIIDLPNLRYIAFNAFFGDFSSLNIPRLEYVTGSLNISDARVPLFSASSLQSVGGDFGLTGNFLEVDLPVLSTVNGDFYVRGATSLNCGLFNHVYVNGTFDCEGTAVPLSTSITTSPTSTATSPTSSHRSATGSTTSATSSGTSTASAASTGLSSAAKGGIGGGVAGGALVIIVLAVWYFWQKRRSFSTFPDKGLGEKKTQGKIATAELPQGHHHERSELEASPNQVSELTGDQEYRPRPPIESLPVTAPSSTQTVEGDSEHMRNARLSSPAELEWARDGDPSSSTFTNPVRLGNGGLVVLHAPRRVSTFSSDK